MIDLRRVVIPIALALLVTACASLDDTLGGEARDSSLPRIQTEVICQPDGSGSVLVDSSKPISNVVARIDGEDIRFEPPPGSLRYVVGLQLGTVLEALFVKSGGNLSREGPGYGERIDITVITTRPRDLVLEELHAGETFCGGPGDDTVIGMSGGVFHGADGNDQVITMTGGVFHGEGDDDNVNGLGFGVFYGDAGSDSVTFMGGGTFHGGIGSDGVGIMNGGTFHGGAAGDGVVHLGTGATFHGEAGDDSATLSGGTFFGGPDNDAGTFFGGGHYDGGSGLDTVFFIFPGDDCTNNSVVDVEVGC